MFGHRRRGFGYAWGGPGDWHEGDDRPTVEEQMSWHHHGHHHGHHHQGQGRFGPKMGWMIPPLLGAFAWHMARRGPFSFGSGPRMFGRGDLKYALLDLLKERPKHGYEMMKELEDRSGGFYTPSAGAIYPTLNLLEDRGWVSVETQDGKKVYTITDEGRKALSEHQERAEERGPRPGVGPGFGPGFGPGSGPGFGPWQGHHHGRHEHGEGRARGPWGWQAVPEMRALAREARDVARLMREAVFAAAGNPERLAQLRGIVERARGELVTFVSQRPREHGAQSQPSQPSQSGQGSESESGQGNQGKAQYTGQPSDEDGPRGPIERL